MMNARSCDITEANVTYPIDPASLASDAEYVAALDELEGLMLAEPGTPAGQRFDELTVLIEEYEARRDGYDLARMRRVLANSGIRVGEARHLRWRDVSSTKTLSGQKRPIFTVRGKTGEREVVCNETVERYVERLRKFRAKRSKP